MFTKKTKKVKNMIKKAMDEKDFTKASELLEVEFEGWKQGFKSGVSSAIGGIVLGVVGVAIINKLNS